MVVSCTNTKFGPFSLRKHPIDCQFHLLCGQFDTQLGKDRDYTLLDLFNFLWPKHQNFCDLFPIVHLHECVRFQTLKEIWV